MFHFSNARTGRSVSGRTISLLVVLALVLALLPWQPDAAVLAATTKEQLDAAVAQQNSIAKKLDQIEKQRDKLNKEKLDLTGDLAWLKTRTKQQQSLYEEKTNQLQAMPVE